MCSQVYPAAAMNKAAGLEVEEWVASGAVDYLVLQRAIGCIDISACMWAFSKMAGRFGLPATIQQFCDAVWIVLRMHR